MIVGPDAARYLHLGQGGRVPRPFCLRWLLPLFCRNDANAWQWCRRLSWVLLAGAMFWFAQQRLDVAHAALAALVVIALPGIRGPVVVNPVGVDLPATAAAVCAAAFATSNDPGWIVAAAVCATVAGTIKETAPLFAALWAWSPWPLVGLAAPVMRAVWVQLRNLEGPDPLGARFQHIADHPVSTAIESHRGRWLDWRLMALPWGVCLIALYDPTWAVVCALAVAHLQLLIATDTVRLVQHAAAPALAVAAVSHLPTAWLLPAAAVHLMTVYRAERV